MKHFIRILIALLVFSTSAFAQAPADPTAQPTTIHIGSIPIQFMPSSTTTTDSVAYETYRHQKIVLAGACSPFYKQIKTGPVNLDVLAVCGSAGTAEDGLHAFGGFALLRVCGISGRVDFDERGRVAYGFSGSIVIDGLGAVTGNSKPKFCGN